MSRFVFILWSIIPRNIRVVGIHFNEQTYYFVWLGKYFAYKV